MYITDLIQMLEEIQKEQGDLRVRANDECGSAVTLTKDSIVVYKNAQGETVVEFDA